MKKEVVSEINDLFEKGFTPGLAYREIMRRRKLTTVNDSELLKLMSDRSIFPRRPDYNYLYTEYHRKKYGTENVKALYGKLDGLYLFVSCLFQIHLETLHSNSKITHNFAKINKRPHWRNKCPPWNFARKLISVHHLIRASTMEIFFENNSEE